MKKKFEIRLIKNKDIENCLKIYEPYVLYSVITFDYFVPTLKEYTNKVNSIQKNYPWLVCLMNGEVVGYVYASTFRIKPAYQWSPESTIYLSEKVQGKGIGRILYETLFEVLRLQGFFNVYAGVVIPNAKSEGLHTAVGFEELGFFKKIGFKHGEWHTTRWFQLHLQAHPPEPLATKKIADIKNSTEFKLILKNANDRLKKIL